MFKKVEERLRMWQMEDMKKKKNKEEEKAQIVQIELQMKNTMSEMYMHWLGLTCRSDGQKKR